jgi:hypothetical protein
MARLYTSGSSALTSPTWGSVRGVPSRCGAAGGIFRYCLRQTRLVFHDPAIASTAYPQVPLLGLTHLKVDLFESFHLLVIFLLPLLFLLHALEISHEELLILPGLPRIRVGHELAFGANVELFRVQSLLLVKAVHLQHPLVHQLLWVPLVLSLV